MGADGGVNWMEVYGDLQEFCHLIRPFRLIWGGSGTGHDDEHNYWLDNNYFDDGKQRIYSVYGTDCCRGGMQELKEIIEYWQDVRDGGHYYWGETNPLNLTWEEILLDYLTHPLYKPEYRKFYGIQHSWEVPPPVILMWEEYKYYVNMDKLTLDYDRWDSNEILKILRMPIGEWLKQIEPRVNLTTVGSAETWT